MTAGGPLPADRVTAIARQQERLARRVQAIDDAVAQLATDVQTLVARSGPTDGGPPMAWLLQDDPGRASMILEDLAQWVLRVYLWYPRAALPSCWLWHPALVEELLCLRQAHAEAYGDGIRTVSKASDFHERYLPGVIARIASGYGDCELARHAADSGGDRRGQIPDLPLWAAADRVAHAWVTASIPDPTSQEIEQAQRYDDARSSRK
jgi:hypothetical protein